MPGVLEILLCVSDRLDFVEGGFEKRVDQILLKLSGVVKERHFSVGPLATWVTCCT